MPPLDLSEFAPRRPAAKGGALDLSEFGPGAKPAVETGPGSSPDNPLQESGLTTEERAAVVAFGPGNVAAAREWLERAPGKGGKPEEFPLLQLGGIKIPTPWDGKTKAYDTHEYKPGHIAVRPKGSSGPWRVVDPDTGFFSTDILRDAMDVVPETFMSTIPGAKPLQVAAATAIGESARRAVGSQYGFKDTPGQVAEDASVQGALAGGVTALAPPVLKGVGYLAKGALKLPAKAGKWLQAPEAGMKQYTGEATEEAIAGGRRALRTEKGFLAEAEAPALAEADDLKALRGRIRGETKEPLIKRQEARATLKEAEATAAREAEEKAAAKAAEPTPAVPEEVAKVADEAVPPLPPEPGPAARALSKLQKFPRPERLTEQGEVAGGVLHPAFGVKAKHLKYSPGFVEAAQSAYGKDFRNVLGSEAMKEGQNFLRRLEKTEGVVSMADRHKTYYKKLAEWIETGGLDKARESALKDAVKAARGGRASAAQKKALDAAAAKKVVESIPAEVREAQKAFKATEAPAARATATRSRQLQELGPRETAAERVLNRIRGERRGLRQRQTDLDIHAENVVKRGVPQTVRGFTRGMEMVGVGVEVGSRKLGEILKTPVEKAQRLISTPGTPRALKEIYTGAIEAWHSGGPSAYRRYLQEALLGSEKAAAEED